jgi:hypothetical protein
MRWRRPFASPLHEVFAHVTDLLGSIGQVVEQTGPSDGEAIVRGVAGAGPMNLNPAVITVTVTSATDGSTNRAHPGGRQGGPDQAARW